MKKLFKSEDKMFYTEYEDIIGWDYIFDEVLENVPLICEQPIIFHGHDGNDLFPVFYVQNNSVIYKHYNGKFYTAEINLFEKIDYTLVNINKILNGNII